MIEKLTTYPRPLPNNPMVVENVGMDNKSLFNKINELVEAVNALVEENNIHEKQIDKPQMMLEPHKCETRPENVQPDVESRPENVLTKSLRMDKEFAEDECVRLQNELDSTRGALNIAIKTLKFIEQQGNCIDVEDEAFDCLETIKSSGVEL